MPFHRIILCQVHWLRPDAQGKPLLMLADEARAAVASASRCDVPFRVALPTYGSAVVCDADGRWLDVLAEESATLPAGSHLVEKMASPADALALLRAWQAERPLWLTGNLPA
jgi:hypothetical protein